MSGFSRTSPPRDPARTGAAVPRRANIYRQYLQSLRHARKAMAVAAGVAAHAAR